MIFLICLLITTAPALLDVADVILYTGG
jgi:hypothetical protein